MHAREEASWAPAQRSRAGAAGPTLPYFATRPLPRRASGGATALPHLLRNVLTRHSATALRAAGHEEEAAALRAAVKLCRKAAAAAASAAEHSIRGGHAAGAAAIASIARQRADFWRAARRPWKVGGCLVQSLVAVELWRCTPVTSRCAQSAPPCLSPPWPAAARWLGAHSPGSQASAAGPHRPAAWPVVGLLPAVPPAAAAGPTGQPTSRRSSSGSRGSSGTAVGCNCCGSSSGCHSSGCSLAWPHTGLTGD